MLKSVEITCWIDPDLEGQAGYSASYGVMQDRTPLYTVALNRQGGFYGISEFVDEAGGSPFVLEQVNNSGRARVAVFDKASGEMLGTIGERKVCDAAGDVLLVLQRVRDQANFAAERFNTAGPEDLVAVTNDAHQVAVFVNMPVSPGMLKRWRRWLEDRSHNTASTVMRIDIARGLLTDERLLYAIAVILHSRKGVILPADPQHEVRHATQRGER